VRLCIYFNEWPLCSASGAWNLPGPDTPNSFLSCKILGRYPGIVPFSFSPEINLEPGRTDTKRQRQVIGSFSSPQVLISFVRGSLLSSSYLICCSPVPAVRSGHASTRHQSASGFVSLTHLWRDATAAVSPRSAMTKNPFSVREPSNRPFHPDFYSSFQVSSSPSHRF